MIFIGQTENDKNIPPLINVVFVSFIENTYYIVVIENDKPVVRTTKDPLTSFTLSLDGIDYRKYFEEQLEQGSKEKE